MDQHQNTNPTPEAETQTYNVKPKRASSGSFAHILIIVLIIAVIGGFSAGAGAMLVKNYFTPEATPGSPALTTQPASTTPVITGTSGAVDIAAIVETVGPSVVSINSTVVYRDFFNMERTGQASGSGVIFAVTDQGVDILTNEHVVADAQEVMVQLKADHYFKAEIIGKDKSTDLAIIRIPAVNISQEIRNSVKAAVFGDSDSLKVGETAIAIGNPLGYNNTVTVGVVSAVDREIKDKNSLKLIQTDAAINPGNSGGALVNTRGEVIGINTIKIASSEVEGIGFAIPSNSAVPIVNELSAKGFVSRPYLGIYGAEINAEASKAYDIPVGIYVRGVIEGSGAEAAGIRAEDVIISVDNTRIETMTQLSDLLKTMKIGDKVRVRVVRGGQTLDLDVTLTDANA